MFALPWIVVLLACGTDADGDGHPAGEDCDDALASVHPGAEEICNGLDDDCDGFVDEDAADAPTWYPDADGDGFGGAAGAARLCTAPEGFLAVGGDCDDADPAVHPGAPETCNGLDDDCSGVADDFPVDGEPWYPDADGDGHGDAAFPHAVCPGEAPPPGYVQAADDCDDARPEAFPGADELCNGLDDDCDGAVDEDLDEVPTWYVDADGDGDGDPALPVAACVQPDGTSPNALDCDDADPDRSTHAAERCDGVDQDCDGEVDEAAVDAPTWYLDHDGDGYGDPALATAACEAPERHVADASDCDDLDPAAYPGAPETCDGSDDDCDGVVDEDDAVDAPTWYLDADGDGHGDPAATVSACTAPAGYVEAPDDCDDADPAVSPDAVEVCGDDIDNDCNGSSDGCRLDGLTGISASDLQLYGTDALDYAGWSVAGGADLTGDGTADVAVGVPGLDGAGPDAGGVAVVAGLPAADLDLAAATALLEGEDTADMAGTALAVAGDVDGNGVADLLVGASAWDGGTGIERGAAWLVGGPLAGTYDLGSATARIEGEAEDDLFGHAVAGGGDVDGDGHDDLLLGAPLSDRSGTDAGTAYLVLGPISAFTTAASADAILEGEDLTDYAGTCVAVMGDGDGDGLADVAVGAILADNLAGEGDEGSVYVLRGPVAGVVDLGAADLVARGEHRGDLAGTACAAAGDVDGDGHDDLLVGAPGSGIGGVLAGAVYLVAGDERGTMELARATARLTGDEAEDQVGYALAGGGDSDGDGFADFLVGAPLDAGTGTDAGSAALVFGPVSGTLRLGNAGAGWLGEDDYSYVGWAVGWAGDPDGDGRDEALVASPTDSARAFGGGAVHVFLGWGF